MLRTKGQLLQFISNQMKKFQPKNRTKTDFKKTTLNTRIMLIEFELKSTMQRFQINLNKKQMEFKTIEYTFLYSEVDSIKYIF